MKRIILPAIVVATATIFTSCTTSEPQANSSPVPVATASANAEANAEQEVRAAHQEYDKASAQQDNAAFERLLADEYKLTDPEGKVFSKAEWIANARSGDFKMEVGKSDDVKVKVYDNTALVTGRWTEKSITKGKKFDGVMQYTTVYVKRNGKWQVVSDHVTVIVPQKPKA